MAFIRRDSHFHIYGDYLSWSRTSGDELIDGVAYLTLEGGTPLAAVAGAIIHWDPIVARIRKSQND
jgi:hypothetical protein